MIKARYFHANALDKLPKIFEQFNTFLSELDDDAVVTVNCTEFGTQGAHEQYSYTVCVVYKEKAK